MVIETSTCSQWWGWVVSEGLRVKRVQEKERRRRDTGGRENCHWRWPLMATQSRESEQRRRREREGEKRERSCQVNEGRKKTGKKCFSWPLVRLFRTRKWRHFFGGMCFSCDAVGGDALGVEVSRSSVSSCLPLKRHKDDEKIAERERERESDWWPSKLDFRSRRPTRTDWPVFIGSDWSQLLLYFFFVIHWPIWNGPHNWPSDLTTRRRGTSGHRWWPGCGWLCVHFGFLLWHAEWPRERKRERERERKPSANFSLSSSHSLLALTRISRFSFLERGPGQQAEVYMCERSTGTEFYSSWCVWESTALALSAGLGHLLRLCTFRIAAAYVNGIPFSPKRIFCNSWPAWTTQPFDKLVQYFNLNRK